MKDLAFPYFQAGTPEPPPPNIRMTTQTIDVLDDKTGIPIAPASREVTDFSSGNDEAIFVLGHMEYSDFFGTHNDWFCTPRFKVKSGTTHFETKNQETCAKYNRIEDQYKQIPKISDLSSANSSALEIVKCEAPKD
jgi:hypothetical protein